jgi:putative thioredoxin
VPKKKIMDFDHEVLEKSHHIAVLVDFWAPWCGPCQHLGPILEELDSETERWELIKINVDENQSISQRFGIRGIPDVRLFYKGEEVAKFSGALPKHQIKLWLDDNLPDPRMEQFSRLMKDPDANSAALLDMLDAHPDLEAGKIMLAEYLVWTDFDTAFSLIGDIQNTKYYSTMDAIRQLHELLQFSSKGESKASEILASAANAIRNEEIETAIIKLIEAIILDKSIQNELPRRATVAVFQLLGSDHSLTKKYRRRFDTALY